ncbi:MAG: ferritin family protein [Rhodospirillaceae bacterium]
MSANAPPIIASVEELLVQARDIEAEAMERYEELADQMEAHNNPRVAKLFRAMAQIEQQQVDRMNVRAEGLNLPQKNVTDFEWPDLEAPESVPIGEGSYDMTEHEALDLALKCEERAWAFFAGVAAASPDRTVRTMATEMADEERQHMVWIHNWIDRLPPRKAPPLDLDDPVDQE